MTGPTTIERLSQRQYEAFWERQPQRDPPTPYTPWDEQAEAIKSMWCDIVRAVLVALREPSEEVLNASPILDWHVDEETGWSFHHRSAHASWQAMIDHILSEPPAGAEDVGREGGK